MLGAAYDIGNDASAITAPAQTPAPADPGTAMQNTLLAPAPAETNNSYDPQAYLDQFNQAYGTSHVIHPEPAMANAGYAVNPDGTVVNPAVANNYFVQGTDPAAMSPGAVANVAESFRHSTYLPTASNNFGWATPDGLYPQVQSLSPMGQAALADHHANEVGASPVTSATPPAMPAQPDASAQVVVPIPDSLKTGEGDDPEDVAAKQTITPKWQLLARMSPADRQTWLASNNVSDNSDVYKEVLAEPVFKDPGATPPASSSPASAPLAPGTAAPGVASPVTLRSEPPDLGTINISRGRAGLPILAPGTDVNAAWQQTTSDMANLMKSYTDKGLTAQQASDMLNQRATDNMIRANTVPAGADPNDDDWRAQGDKNVALHYWPEVQAIQKDADGNDVTSPDQVDQDKTEEARQAFLKTHGVFTDDVLSHVMDENPYQGHQSINDLADSDDKQESYEAKIMQNPATWAAWKKLGDDEAKQNAFLKNHGIDASGTVATAAKDADDPDDTGTSLADAGTDAYNPADNRHNYTTRDLIAGGLLSLVGAKTPGAVGQLLGSYAQAKSDEADSQDQVDKDDNAARLSAAQQASQGLLNQSQVQQNAATLARNNAADTANVMVGLGQAKDQHNMNAANVELGNQANDIARAGIAQRLAELNHVMLNDKEVNAEKQKHDGVQELSMVDNMYPGKMKEASARMAIPGKTNAFYQTVAKQAPGTYQKQIADAQAALAQAKLAQARIESIKALTPAQRDNYFAEANKSNNEAHRSALEANPQSPQQIKMTMDALASNQNADANLIRTYNELYGPKGVGGTPSKTVIDAFNAAKTRIFATSRKMQGLRDSMNTPSPMDASPVDQTAPGNKIVPNPAVKDQIGKTTTINGKVIHY